MKPRTLAGTRARHPRVRRPCRLHRLLATVPIAAPGSSQGNGSGRPGKGPDAAENSTSSLSRSESLFRYARGVLKVLSKAQVSAACPCVEPASSRKNVLPHPKPSKAPKPRARPRGRVKPRQGGAICRAADAGRPCRQPAPCRKSLRLHKRGGSIRLSSSAPRPAR